MSKHTATPWRTYNQAGMHSTGITSATAHVGFANTDEDAALIVRAVNNHARLVAALEALLKWATTNITELDVAPMFNEARAALEAAKS